MGPYSPGRRLLPGDAWTWPVTWRMLGQAAFSVTVDGKGSVCGDGLKCLSSGLSLVSGFSVAVSVFSTQGAGCACERRADPCHSAEPSSGLHLTVWKAEVLTPTCDIWRDLFLFPSLASPPYSVCFSLTDPLCHSPHVQTHSCLKTFVLAVLC